MLYWIVLSQHHSVYKFSLTKIILKIIVDNLGWNEILGKEVH